MKKYLHACEALILSGLLTTTAFATTATTLNSFEGIEEPTVRYLVSSGTFATNDPYVNITEQGGGVFRFELRFVKNNWWDGDRATTLTDRGRAEVKGLGNHQKDGDTIEYSTTWRTSPNWVSSGQFCHIFQLKTTDTNSVMSNMKADTNGVARFQNHSKSNDTTPRSWNYSINTFQTVKLRIKISTTSGIAQASVNGDAFVGESGGPNYWVGAADYRPKWGLYRKQTNDMNLGDNYIEHSNVQANSGSTPIGVSSPSFSPGSGTYNSAQSVTITTATSGASIRYTLDGSTPSATVGTVYTVPVSIGSTTTLNAIAYKSGSADSAVTSATYTITAPQAAAPTFSPGGGTYTSAQSVTISTATSGASIRYTTDGSTPTETSGTVYSGPVAISVTKTLKAISYGSGLTPSAVTTATYTITAPTLAWEAETLTRTVGGATATNDTDAAASGGVRVTLNGNSTGDYVQFTLPNVPAGTYSLKLAYKTNNNRGKATFTVDGATVGGTLDQYASASTYPTATIATVTFATAGSHTLRMTVASKNGSSSSYTLSADKFTLVAQ